MQNRGITLISQKLTDSAVILAIAGPSVALKTSSTGFLVTILFGHSRTMFSKNTFSLHLLTLGYHFRLTSTLPRHF